MGRRACSGGVVSAVSDFIIRVCEAAGLDPADESSWDAIWQADQGAQSVPCDPAEHFAQIVATLRQAPRPCTRCTMTVSGLHDGNVVNGRTYCRECSGIVAQTPTDRRERAERAR